MIQEHYGTATVQSVSRTGLHCTPVEIEVDVAPGLPQCIIVGLPDAAVFEARDRVRSAVKNSGFRFPSARVTVNLAPAHTKKSGSAFDLPIALGILAAAGQATVPANHLYAGELALDGRLRSITGAIPLMRHALSNRQTIILPAEQEQEVQLLQNDRLRTACTLREVVERPSGIKRTTVKMMHTEAPKGYMNLADVHGQHAAKRALEIAAAGGHNILFSGPPGVGKSLLASALPGLLPPLTAAEVIDTTMIYSLLTPGLVITERPFRSPHHTASPTALLGGGVSMRPGELSLAHHGVLFLDELPEFRRDAIEVLRQPMEERFITINRIHGQVRYPADCMVVAAYNPCPCGYANSIVRECTCSQQEVRRYTKKLSGPLLDRFDIKCVVTETDPTRLFESAVVEESSETVRKRVAEARSIQHNRQHRPNAALSGKQSERLSRLPQTSQHLLTTALLENGVSTRGYHKTLKVARTIADLEGTPQPTDQHVAEALQYVLGVEAIVQKQ